MRVTPGPRGRAWALMGASLAGPAAAADMAPYL